MKYGQVSLTKVTMVRGRLRAVLVPASAHSKGPRRIPQPEHCNHVLPPVSDIWWFSAKLCSAPGRHLMFYAARVGLHRHVLNAANNEGFQEVVPSDNGVQRAAPCDWIRGYQHTRRDVRPV